MGLVPVSVCLQRANSLPSIVERNVSIPLNIVNPALSTLCKVRTYARTNLKPCTFINRAAKNKMVVLIACTCLIILALICAQLQKKEGKDLKNSTEEVFEKALDLLLTLIESGKSSLNALFFYLLKALLAWAEFLLMLCEYYAKRPFFNLPSK